MSYREGPRGAGPGYTQGPTGPTLGQSPYASSAGGPAGVGGSGGFGFVNIGQFLGANPNNSLDPRAGVPETGGYAGASSSQAFNPSAHAFDASGGYTPGMSALDSMLNGAYGHTSTPTGYDTPTGQLSSTPQSDPAGGANPSPLPGAPGGSRGGAGPLPNPSNPGNGRQPAALYGTPSYGTRNTPRSGAGFPGISSSLGPRYS